MLTLAPLVLFFTGLALFVHSIKSPIGDNEWEKIFATEEGFQAMIPGTPHLDRATMKTAAGIVEICLIKSRPEHKSKFYTVLAMRFPEEISRQPANEEILLEYGLQDLCRIFQGQCRSKNLISVSDLRGLELEVLPRQGAMIRARLFASRNYLYRVTAQTSRIRLQSDDVEKFFDSFQLSTEPVTAARDFPEFR